MDEPVREIVTRPTAIPVSIGDSLLYSMIYYVWGLPSGDHRVMMQETEYAPTNFRLLLRYVRPVYVAVPRYLGDTLNAYASCYWRASDVGNLTQALSWTDSIFTLNPNSVVGYRLRSLIYAKQNNISSAIMACDSAIAISDRYDDPALPDSVDMKLFIGFGVVII